MQKIQSNFMNKRKDQLIDTFAKGLKEALTFTDGEK